MSNTPLDANYWNDRYKNNDTGWDAGTITTPIKEYIDQWENKSAAILIPGCGNSYEAEYLLENGFTNITLIDIAPDLTEALRLKYKDQLDKTIHIITGDFFELKGSFDLIIEQTFFCALDPSLREAYTKKIKSLLAPEGILAGVMFNREFPVGPPFGGSSDEYQKLFSAYFTIKTLAPCYNSIPPRAGSEVFVELGV